MKTHSCSTVYPLDLEENQHIKLIEAEGKIVLGEWGCREIVDSHATLQMDFVLGNT